MPDIISELQLSAGQGLHELFDDLVRLANEVEDLRRLDLALVPETTLRRIGGDLGECLARLTFALAAKSVIESHRNGGSA